MRSTTFLFITQYTSVQVLGEKRSRSCLSQHIALGTMTRRDVPERRPRVPRLGPPAASAPSLARAFPRLFRAPRRLGVIPSRHVPRLPSPAGHAAMDRWSLPCRAAELRTTCCPLWTTGPSVAPARAGRLQKGGRDVSLAQALPPAQSRAAQSPWARPRRALSRAPSRRRTTTPAPPLAPTEARRPPVAAAVAPPRRKRGAPQQAPVASAVQPRWRPHHFELRAKSRHQTPLVLLRPRPAASLPEFGRTAAGRCPGTTLQGL
jgi:hypothetical protein